MEESSHHHHRHQQQQLLLLHHHQQRQQQQPLPHNSRLGALRGAAGEVVEVSGGHIVRSTGRKDRHSKVCTAKGLRDRRVRLSAHTAIQFYDVQDRLGYDRPSKAVDWLLKHAKASIDELAELPRWHPPTTTTISSSNPSPPSDQHDLHEQPVPTEPAADQGAYSSATFLPSPLNSDSIADTIKTFFPMATTPASSSYQNYPPDLVSRSSNQAQDLRLSLQSFQDPMFHQNQTPAASSQQNFLSGNLAFGSASASWPEQNQRVVAWNLAENGDGGGGGGGGGGDGGYGSNMPPPQAVPLHPALSLSQLFSQRGTLQSSNLPSVRAWMDPTAAAAGHQIHPAGIHSSWPSVTATGFVFSDSGGFSGFHIPAWLQGEEEHGGISSKPPSDSSASNH